MDNIFTISSLDGTLLDNAVSLLVLWKITKKVIIRVMNLDDNSIIMPLLRSSYVSTPIGLTPGQDIEKSHQKLALELKQTKRNITMPIFLDFYLVWAVYQLISQTNLQSYRVQHSVLLYKKKTND